MTTRETVSVSNDLAECSRMLDQSISEVRALKSQVAVLEKLNAVNSEIIAKKDEQITEQKRLIAIYEKRKGTKISFLFGLVKFTKY